MGGRTPLMHATLRGYKDLVELFISRGADVKAKSRQTGETALMYALGNGKTDIAQLLISKDATDDTRDNNGNSALMYALIHDQPEMAKLLISKGANILAENREGSTVLTIASAFAQKEIVELLISKGVPVNSQNRNNKTPLLSAAWNGETDIIKILVEQGADVNQKDSSGMTALMAAAWFGHKKTAELLISKGAYVNAQDYNGISPLMYTAISGEKEFAPDAEGKIPSEYYVLLSARQKIAELLILKGANLNLEDYEGRTALLYATMNNLTGMAKLLISHKANVNIKDYNGNTPLSHALKNNNKGLAKLIRPITVNLSSKKQVRELSDMKISDNALREAGKTLISFFNYLHDEQYDKAVPLFEPGGNGSWEGLASFSLAEDRNDKGKVLANYCRAVGTCVRAKIVNVKKVDVNKYRFRMQFLKDDGNIFELGACCGESEEDMTPQREFVYFVDRIEGLYKVRTPPVYVP